MWSQVGHTIPKNFSPPTKDVNFEEESEGKTSQVKIQKNFKLPLKLDLTFKPPDMENVPHQQPPDDSVRNLPKNLSNIPLNLKNTEEGKLEEEKEVTFPTTNATNCPIFIFQAEATGDRTPHHGPILGNHHMSQTNQHMAQNLQKKMTRSTERWITPNTVRTHKLTLQHQPPKKQEKVKKNILLFEHGPKNARGENFMQPRNYTTSTLNQPQVIQTTNKKQLFHPQKGYLNTSDPPPPLTRTHAKKFIPLNPPHKKQHRLIMSQHMFIKTTNSRNQQTPRLTQSTQYSRQSTTSSMRWRTDWTHSSSKRTYVPAHSQSTPTQEEDPLDQNQEDIDVDTIIEVKQELPLPDETDDDEEKSEEEILRGPQPSDDDEPESEIQRNPQVEVPQEEDPARGRERDHHGPPPDPMNPATIHPGHSRLSPLMPMDIIGTNRSVTQSIQKLFDLNPEKTANWKRLAEVTRAQNLKRQIQTENTEKALNSFLQNKKLPPLTAPQTSELDFLTQWTTLQRGPPKKKMSPKKFPKRPPQKNKILNWKKLKCKTFRLTQQHFLHQGNKRDKIRKLKQELDKLSTKTEKRKHLKPSFQLKRALTELKHALPETTTPHNKFFSLSKEPLMPSGTTPEYTERVDTGRNKQDMPASLTINAPKATSSHQPPGHQFPRRTFPIFDTEALMRDTLQSHEMKLVAIAHNVMEPQDMMTSTATVIPRINGTKSGPNEDFTTARIPPNKKTESMSTVNMNTTRLPEPNVIAENLHHPVVCPSGSNNLKSTEHSLLTLQRMKKLILQVSRKFPRLNPALWQSVIDENCYTLNMLEIENLIKLLRHQPAKLSEQMNYSDSWLQPEGLLASLKQLFAHIYPVKKGTHIFPLNYKPGFDTDVLDRLFFAAGLLVNPPFSDINVEIYLNHLVSSALKQVIVTYTILPYLPNRPWFKKLLKNKVPGIHLQNSLVFLDANKKVWGTSTNTVCIFLLGATGPFVSTLNSPLGTFSLSKDTQKRFTFPPPPIQYVKETKKIFIPGKKREQDGGGIFKVPSKLFSDLHTQVEKACHTLQKIQQKGKLNQRYPELFQTTMAENMWDLSHTTEEKIPEWLKFQTHQQNVKENISDIVNTRHIFPKKFTLAVPGETCKTCGQTTHISKNCWRAPLSWEMLKSTDPRDKTMLTLMRKFQPKPTPSPPETITSDWLLNTFWPHAIAQEKKWENRLMHTFKKNHPRESVQKYLRKFHLPFSRTFLGIGFAFAIGVHKEAVIRMFFGIPRHNAVETPPYDVAQKVPPKMNAELHKIHVKKVAEGKLAEVPESYLNAILPNFAIQEKDKTREIVDAFTENICHPPQSVKMVRIEDLLNFPPTSVSMPLDAKSAFDQIKVTPATTKWQGQTSTDPAGQKHFYAALGLPMGVCYCPKRCQGQLCDMLDPVRKLLTTLKVYIDDLLPIFDADHMNEDEVGIIFDSILVIIHKLGLKISEKCFPEITTAPTYLGYILDLKQNCFYPHYKHLQKATALIFDALNPEKKTTFRNYLQIKGILTFALKERGVHLCQFMDNYTRTQFHAHGRDIKEILTDIMPPSTQFLEFVKQFTTLLSEQKNYTFRAKTFHPDAKTKIVIATDASPEKAGGFCLINGSTPTELQHFPVIQMSDSFENPDTPYQDQRWISLSWSSTDIERSALHRFLTKYLHPYLKKLNPPRPVSIVSLTDSQSLAYQLRQMSNKNTLTNKEIKECLDILTYWDENPQIYWHSRSTRLGRQADARTRDILTLPDHIITRLSTTLGQTLSPFLDQVTLRTLGPFTKLTQEMTTAVPNTLPMVFPHPNTSQKQLKQILELLSVREQNVLLITPGINTTKLLLPHTIYPTIELGYLKDIDWPDLPANLRQKNYPLLAIHLNRHPGK